MMENFLSVENLTYHWGELRLFNDINFGISEGQKTALIARNGTGKSTLLQMLVGRMKPDSGRIIFNDSVRLGYLEQSPHFEGDRTVMEQVFNCPTPTTKAIADYELAVARGDEVAIQKAIERMDSLGAWDYEQRVRQILTQLKITDFNQRVQTLSGGQQKRIALAALLVSEPNFIILDEPTNHLDLDITQWLEDYLTRANVTLIMVTHDRYFLDRVCTDIFELDDEKIYHYAGNYAYFVQKKQERAEQLTAEADKARNLLRKEQDWMNRQPQARATKAQYRIDAYYELKEKAKAPTEQRSLELKFEASRLGRKVVDISDVSKSFGEKKLFEHFTYKFAQRERVGIIGDNGAGKSTLLNIIVGRLAPDAGSVEIGSTVVVGYYKQEGIVVDDSKTLIEVITDIAETVAQGEKRMTAAQFLRYFLFPNEMHRVQVNKLSGGERKRLYLMTVLMRNPNLLILDEPTNDLDILTLNVLEEYLTTFGGTVIVVSHDRFFMDKIAEHLFVLDGSGIVKDFPGNYSDYIAWKRQREKMQSSEVKTEEKPRQKERARRLSYAEKRELESIDVELPRLTSRRAEVENLLSGAVLSADEIAKLSAEYSDLASKIDELEMRWLELSEIEA